MARARTGGAGSGYAWALVIFGAGFVICLLLAIVFLAQLGGAREERDEATARLRQFVSANEEAMPELTAVTRGPGQTYVGALLDQNRTLKEIIVGDPEAPLEEIQQEKQTAGVDVALMRELQGLRAERDDLQSQLDAAKQARDAQAQRAEQALKEREQLAQRYTQSVQELEGQIAQLQQDLQSYQGRVAQLERDLTERFGTERRELAQQTAELERQLAARNVEIEQLRRIIDELTDATEGEVAKIAQTDATITGVVADQNRVYLNRGSDDRVILGMTFEVFDDGSLVRLEEGVGELRGKATVEVIDVRDNSSLARVVRVERGQAVDEGDQLVNIVYDPDATQKFYVYGDFDIDNTGQSQVQDRGRIEGIIRQWGGVLAGQLSYDVDFLVLGKEPPLPEPLPPGVIDPVRIAENVEQQKNYETYQQLVGEARDLNIPILNQNRFLNLVGFYRR